MFADPNKALKSLEDDMTSDKSKHGLQYGQVIGVAASRRAVFDGRIVQYQYQYQYKYTC